MFLLLFLFIGFSVTQRYPELKPEVELIRERLPLGEVKTYALKDFKTDTVYEVKVSYTSVEPAKFDVFVIFPSNKKLKKKGSRELLSVEKSVFTTRRIPEDSQVLVYVKADREGVAATDDESVRYIYYNIIVEKLYFGFVSKDAFRMAVICVIVLMVILFVVLPMVYRMFTRLLGWDKEEEEGDKKKDDDKEEKGEEKKDK